MCMSHMHAWIGLLSAILHVYMLKRCRPVGCALVLFIEAMPMFGILISVGEVLVYTLNSWKKDAILHCNHMNKRITRLLDHD